MIACSLFPYLFAVMAASVNAQVFFNKTSDQYECPVGGNSYCASKSLTSNIIYRCAGTRAYAGNCNDNLAGVPPIGVKSTALCSEASPSAGIAACSINGFAYPDNGEPFPVASGSFPSTNNTTNTSTTTTTGPSAFHTPPGMSVAPGSGGYNGSITITTAPSSPSSTSPPPGAITPFIGGSESLKISGVMMLGSALLVLTMIIS